MYYQEECPTWYSIRNSDSVAEANKGIMTEKETWEAAAEEIRGWMRLQVKAHETTPYANPTEALREHKNQMSQLGVILSKFLKKSGMDPKDVFEELKKWKY